VVWINTITLARANMDSSTTDSMDPAKGRVEKGFVEDVISSVAFSSWKYFFRTEMRHIIRR